MRDWLADSEDVPIIGPYVREEWLPANVSYNASARIALFKMYREGYSADYSNYRKFTVDTAATYAVPKGPGTPQR